MKLNNLDSNIILSSMKEAEEAIKGNEIPAGYIEINLSTKGKVGAPKSFHVRNFKVGEILTLSLSSDEELPRRLIDILNDAILEDIDVSQFHENEVIELMLYVYSSFYQRVIEDIQFPLDDEDIDHISSTNEALLKDLAESKWIPRTSIDINSDIDLYDIDEDAFNPNITIKDKQTGFYVTFGFIKYGDRLVVKKWLDDFYKEEESKFEKIKKQIQYNNNFARNPERQIKIDPDEEKAYNDYLTEKMQTLADVSRIISITDYNGMDVSNMSIGDKYKLMSSDARIDYGMISKLIKRQNKIPFGLKPIVRMKDPILNKPCERRFSFRIPLIIQAMQVSGYDRYDDGYDDEDIDNL